MNEKDLDDLLRDSALTRWRNIIGELPLGFYLDMERGGDLISLYYNGTGYMGITQPGGEKPRESDEVAFVGCFSKSTSSREGENFVKGCIAQVQKALSSTP